MAVRNETTSSSGKKNALGRTELHNAVGRGDEHFVQQLLQSRADLESKDGSGRTSLHLAAQEGQSQIIQMLLMAKASTEATDQCGWTPLHLAAQEGQIQIVQMLLKAGASTEATDERGRTPLSLASDRKRQKAVAVLQNADKPRKFGYEVQPEESQEEDRLQRMSEEVQQVNELQRLKEEVKQMKEVHQEEVQQLKEELRRKDALQEEEVKQMKEVHQEEVQQLKEELRKKDALQEEMNRERAARQEKIVEQQKEKPEELHEEWKREKEVQQEDTLPQRRDEPQPKELHEDKITEINNSVDSLEKDLQKELSEQGNKIKQEQDKLKALDEKLQRLKGLQQELPRTDGQEDTFQQSQEDIPQAEAHKDKIIEINNSVDSLEKDLQKELSEQGRKIEREQEKAKKLRAKVDDLKKCQDLRKFPCDEIAERALFLVSGTNSWDAALLAKINKEKREKGERQLSEAQNTQLLLHELEVNGFGHIGCGVEELLQRQNDNKIEAHRPLLECVKGGIRPLICDFDLRLKQGMGKTLHGKDWLQHYKHYASKTKFGVLILAGDEHFFRLWAGSKACLKEVKDVPEDRLFAYIDGCLVRVNKPEKPASSKLWTSHRASPGCIVWSAGELYLGSLKDELQEGQGSHYFKNGDVYTGGFAKGKQHGNNGEYKFATGESLQGTWEEGKVIVETCKFKFADGNEFKGSWPTEKCLDAKAILQFVKEPPEIVGLAKELSTLHLVLADESAHAAEHKSYKGAMKESAKICWASFPQKFLLEQDPWTGADSAWDCLKHCEDSVASVALNEPEDGLGKHHPEGSNQCLCRLIYGDRDYLQLGYLLKVKGSCTAQERGFWERYAAATNAHLVFDKVDAEDHQEAQKKWLQHGKRAAWGCRWFQLWFENVKKAVAQGQKLKVVYHPGQTGYGKVHWDRLQYTDLWSGDGCTASQKIQIAKLDQMKMRETSSDKRNPWDYEEIDLTEFMALHFEEGTEVDFLNPDAGTTSTGKITKVPDPNSTDPKWKVKCETLHASFETTAIWRPAKTFEKVLGPCEERAECKFKEILNDALQHATHSTESTKPRILELTAEEVQKTRLRNGVWSLAAKVKLDSVEDGHALGDAVLSDRLADELNKHLKTKLDGRKLVVDKTQFIDTHARTLLTFANLTDHQEDKLKQLKATTHQHIHLEAPAGAGKTFVALHYVFHVLSQSTSQRVAYTCPSRPLIFHFLRCFYLQHLQNAEKKQVEKSFSTLVTRMVVMEQPYKEFMSVTLQDSCFVLKKMQDQPTNIVLAIFDEAHDICSTDAGSLQIKQVKATQKMILSDLSQSHLLNVDWGHDVKWITVSLTEVVRSTKIIVLGAKAFRRNCGDPEKITCMGTQGPPLKPFLFSPSHDGSKLFEEFANKTLEAMRYLKREYPSIRLERHTALLVPDEGFLKNFQPQLATSLKRHEDLFSGSCQITSFKDSLQYLPDAVQHHSGLILDCNSNAKGLEKFFVVCIGFDQKIDRRDGDANNATRARLYHGLTRAQYQALVVDKVVPGGWFEFLKTLEYRNENINFEDADEGIREDVAEEVVQQKSNAGEGFLPDMRMPRRKLESRQIPEEDRAEVPRDRVSRKTPETPETTAEGKVLAPTMQPKKQPKEETHREDDSAKERGKKERVKQEVKMKQTSVWDVSEVTKAGITNLEFDPISRISTDEEVKMKQKSVWDVSEVTKAGITNLEFDPRSTHITSQVHVDLSSVKAARHRRSERPPPEKETRRAVITLHLVLKERPANLVHFRGMNYLGNIKPDAQVCWASFPGKFKAGWESLIRNCKEDSMACVFSDDDERVLGTHHFPDPERPDQCWCPELYGERDYRTFGYLLEVSESCTHEERKSWERRAKATNAHIVFGKARASDHEVAKSLWEANFKRPAWGCAWFHHWLKTVEVAVRLKQQLRVVYFPGQVGYGKVHWDMLRCADLWNGDGCGGSQKAEIAKLDQMGLSYDEVDVATFLAGELQVGDLVDFIDPDSGDLCRGRLVQIDHDNTQFEVETRNGKSWAKSAWHTTDFFANLLRQCGRKRFQEILEEVADLTVTGFQESRLQNGQVSLAVKVELPSIREAHTLRDAILSDKLAERLNKMLANEHDVNEELSFHKSQFFDSYARTLPTFAELTPHQAEKLRELLEHSDEHIHLRGCAGTGKTFIALAYVFNKLERGLPDHVLYICPSLSLILHFVQWLFMQATTLLPKTPFRDLLTRIVVMHAPYETFMSVTMEHSRTILRSLTEEPKDVVLAVFDEAHEVFGTDNSIFQRIAAKQKIILSDFSQSDLFHQDYVAEVSCREVSLTEVVRSTKIIVMGAKAFRRKDDEYDEKITCMGTAGPPLKSFFFESSTDGMELFEEFANKTLEAMRYIMQKYPDISPERHMALLVPDEEFRDYFKLPLQKAIQDNFSPAWKIISFQHSLSYGYQPGETIVVDSVHNSKGLEKLIVVCVGLDKVTFAGDNITRAKIYHGLTRAQLVTVVVDRLVHGGWFESIATLTFRQKRDVIEDEEIIELNRVSPSKVVG